MEDMLLIDLMRKYNSYYLYDESKILFAMETLKNEFPNVKFLYSLKTNPNEHIVKTVLSNGFGSDAASLNEVKMSIQNGVPKEMLQYSAPGKLRSDIEEAIDQATLIADSVNEVSTIQEVAKEKGIHVEIGIRINPNFSFDGGKGTPSKFGIDEDQVYSNMSRWRAMENIKITGIHVHLRSQELSSDLIGEYHKNVLNLALRVQESIGEELKFINMGSGIGIPYSTSDEEVDLGVLGQHTSNLVSELKYKLPAAQVYIETGRYVVGKAGIYVTTVVDKKISGGKTFVILNSTLNGFSRPSLEQLVRNYTSDENPAAFEPLFTKKNAFQYIPLINREVKELVTLVGNLCTGADLVAKDTELPMMDPGDGLMITNAGSYARVLTPLQFSSQVPPIELFLKTDGTVMEDLCLEK